MLNDSPVKSLLYITTFLFLTPIALTTSIFALSILQKQPPSQPNPKVLSSTTRNSIVFASIPNSLPEISSNLEIDDARPEILKEYLSYYKSPLIPYSQLLVDTADKYNLDFRLLVAIAQQESNLCKKIPINSYNCWGWGIHSKGTLYFNSYQEAIETISEGIRENYINEGYATVDEIMDKWVPGSPERSWSKGVTTFMSSMQ